MMHEQLTISQLLDHAAENHGERQIACFAGAQTVRYNYATLRDRVSRLVGVLRRLGVSQAIALRAWHGILTGISNFISRLRRSAPC